MSESAVINAFIGDVKSILSEDGETDAGFARIAERMASFIGELPGDGNEPTGNVHSGRQSSALYTDDTGLTLVRARFGPEAMTPIHNHGSWGVIGVYKGRDRYQIWQRLDDGEGDGAAEVRLVEERVLGPGDVAILPPPPQDIHAQQGLDGEAAYEYVLFGRNAMTLPRLYFDHEAGTAREVLPGQR